MLRPVSTSWSMCQLTKETNLMETLKGRSFPPSPGRVTSRSTCRGKRKEEGKKGQRGLYHSQLHLERQKICVFMYICMRRYTECVGSGDGELWSASVGMYNRCHCFHSACSKVYFRVCVCLFSFHLTPVGATGSGLAVYKLFFPSQTGLRSPKIVTLKCCTIESTTSLYITHTKQMFVIQ